MNWQELKIPDYYRPYAGLVTEQDLTAALESSRERLKNGNLRVWKQLGDQVYAPGKWTIRDIFQHLADCERIMSYRALRFARNDQSLLPSFDENIFAAEAAANSRPLETILEELVRLRISTQALFSSFSPEMLLRTGKCMGQDTAVAALGFVIAGHQAHHLNVIAERYLPLIN